jgi:hypothetical protein
MLLKPSPVNVFLADIIRIQSIFCRVLSHHKSPLSSGGFVRETLILEGSEATSKRQVW